MNQRFQLGYGHSGMGVLESVRKAGDCSSECGVRSWGFNGDAVFVDAKILVWPCEWGIRLGQDTVMR